MSHPIDDLDDERAALLRQALEAGHEICFIALGGSMKPMIPPQAKVTIQAIDPGSLRWGEVALTVNLPVASDHAGQKADTKHHLRAHGERDWVLHRVIYNDRRAQRIFMAGDRLPISDPPRHYSQVLGVLSHIEFKSGARSFLKPRSLFARSLGMCTLLISRGFFRLRSLYRHFTKSTTQR